MTRAVGAAVLWVRDCARRCGRPRAAPLLLLSGLGGTLLRAAVSMISASSSSVVRIICASLLLPVLLVARFRNPGLNRAVRSVTRGGPRERRGRRAPRPRTRATLREHRIRRTPEQRVSGTY